MHLHARTHTTCPAQGAVAGDVDGDGLLEIVFGTVDGRVHAVRGTDGSAIPNFPFQVCVCVCVWHACALLTLLHAMEIQSAVVQLKQLSLTDALTPTLLYLLSWMLSVHAVILRALLVLAAHNLCSFPPAPFFRLATGFRPRPPSPRCPPTTPACSTSLSCHSMASCMPSMASLAAHTRSTSGRTATLLCWSMTCVVMACWSCWCRR